MNLNRRSFFGMTLAAVGALGVSRLFRSENSFAAPPVIKAKGGAKTHAVMATEESLKGIPKATNVTEANFFQEGDAITTVQNYCNAGIDKNPKCGPQRKAGQFCGNCLFFKKETKVVYDGDAASECQLIQAKDAKKLVHGHNYCASYANNAAVKYEIKS
jgi:hypothetical protein